MSGEAQFVFLLLGITIALFVWDRLRMDLVALGVMVVLALSGILTPAEVVSGFGNSIVVMIAALFVVGEGLFRTGVAAAAGRWILRMGGESEQRLLLLIIPVVALLSAFMSSTGAVALFIPVLMSVARNSGMSPSRLLMPLAYGSLMGGMLTLIGTPPNIVVSQTLRDAGYEPFGFFEFTPIGAVILLIGTAYLVWILPRFVPQREPAKSIRRHRRLHDYAEIYGIEGNFHRLRVRPYSPLCGKTVVEAGLRTNYECTVFGIQRRGRLLSSQLPVLGQTRMQSDDLLLIHGLHEDVARLTETFHLQEAGFPEVELERVRQEFGALEILVTAKSALISKTIKDVRFRERYQLSIVGVRRNGEPVEAEFTNTPLAMGDTLLLIGSWKHLQQLHNQEDFVVLDTPEEMQEVSSRIEKAPLAVMVMLGMLVLMVGGILPSLTAILVAAVTMIGCGCVTLPEAYRSLNATSLVLIAGLLPLALAMDKTGGVGLLANQLSGALAAQSPLWIGALFFMLTSLFSQFISNTATTVLVAPIALATALQLELNPEPFMMMVAIAASTAFCTPIASPVNTLVLAPGHYRFMDFVRAGVPLQLVCLVVALVLVPALFPFS